MCLDALCVLGNGTKCNVEVQRTNNDNHLKRVRLNASLITARDSETGMKFDDVLDLCVVYITEKDFLKGNKTIYHVDKMIRETGEAIDDGLQEIFVNTEINDNTAVSELMECFVQREVNNSKFPALSAEVKRLKETEGGNVVMGEIMQKIVDAEVCVAKKEAIINFIRLGISKDKIISLGYDENLYEEAQAEMPKK